MSVLVPQVRTNPEANLIISNNASPDDTAEYLRRWEGEQRVQIFHQRSNLGVNLHVAWLYRTSNEPLFVANR